MSKNNNQQSVLEQVIELIKQHKVVFQKDNYGQIVIYTGLYEWSDKSIHFEEETK